MKEDVKNMWVEDLLDPPVPQGKELLVKFDVNGEPEEACCLGILTLRAIKEGVEGVRIEKDEEPDPISGQVHAYVEFLDANGNWSSGHDEQLPPPVAKWAGLVADAQSEDEDPVFEDGTVPMGNPELNGVQAIERNDYNGDTFEAIAAAIREDPDL